MPKVEVTMQLDLPAEQEAFERVMVALMAVKPPSRITATPTPAPETTETANGADDNLVPMRQRPAAPPAPAQDPEARAAEIKLNRQRAAAAARAAKEAKAGMPVTDVLGPNGQDEGEEVLDDPSMSPGEAHDAALVIIRRAYYAGREAEVQVLRKEYGVTRFTDIPQEKGHELFRKATRLAKTLGLS